MQASKLNIEIPVNYVESERFSLCKGATLLVVPLLTKYPQQLEILNVQILAEHVTIIETLLIKY